MTYLSTPTRSSRPDPSLAYEYTDAFVFFRDLSDPEVLYCDDPSFKESFARNISLLYDDRIAVDFPDGHPLLRYREG